MGCFLCVFFNYTKHHIPTKNWFAALHCTLYTRWSWYLHSYLVSRTEHCYVTANVCSSEMIYLPWTVMGSWSTHTVQWRPFYKAFFFINDINFIIFVKLFDKKIIFPFIQNRDWLGLKHFSSPNDSVHCTHCTVKYFFSNYNSWSERLCEGIGPNLRKDDR